MTHARETLTIMDSNQPNGTFPSKRRRGIFLSKNLIWLILVIFALALICTSFIVYNFAACPRTDQLANVTKFELHTCDSHKLSVLPLATPVPKLAATVEFSPRVTTSTIASITESREDALRITDVRLPKTMYPEKYNLKLTPYIFEGNFTFEGEVSINLHVTNETNKIVFHAVDLHFQHLVVYQEHTDGSYIIINKLKRSEDALRQYHILELAENLRAGEKYKMNITYQGYLNDNLHGFYRSSYLEKNVTRWIAVTQFQPTDARRAFPCFDEPALKARFTISIARPRHLSSLSNMNAVGHPTRHETLEDYVWDHYAESLPMSTYLVAFAVTDFGHLSDQNFAVWARHEALQSASYALEIGPKILNFFEEFYKIEFPLPKIDMIALPDFNSGAMENWGLLTFRETAMLYQSDISPRTTQPRVAAVVAHEIAHQWFGNLVTPAWWSDIWLNEGFASYLEYVAVDAIEPSWNIMEIFVLNEVQSVFRLDAMESSHQISIEVGNPEEIKDIFDMISYRKGSAILRMMNHFLKSEVFNEGITNYLNEKTYGSAEQDDLWRALTEVARKNDPEAADVAVVMDSWTLQTGFPVLTVTRDYGSDTITFDQDRFLLVNNTQEKNPMWWIPISYTTGSEKNFNITHPRLWLKGNKSVTVSDIIVKPEDWLVINIQLTGFYRVNYDKENWDLIIEVLNNPNRFQDIHPINRAQIIDDAMNLALAGRLSYQTAMDVTKYLAHEKSYIPWKAGLLALGYIDTMFAKGSYYLEYKRHIAHLLSGVLEELGWEMVANESVIRTQHRADMLSTACHLEIEGCLSHAVRLYTNWMLTPNPDLYNEISADVRSTVYCVGVQAGGSREWSFAWDRFRAATVPSERELLISVLGCTRAPYLLYRYLELSLRNDSGIRKQDTVRVFSAVSSSTVGQSIAFNFVRSNWNRLKEYFGSYSALNLILKAVTWRMNQQYELDEVRNFAEEHCAELGNRSIQQVLERTASNVQWMDRNYQTIINWLLAAEAKSTES